MKRLLFLCFTSCGGPDIQMSLSLKPVLQEEIARITPLLHICNQMPAKVSDMNHPNGQNCDIGDGMTDAGFSTLYGGFDFKLGVYNSISEDGRPWRNPLYVGVDPNNSFSRDQLLGVIEYVVATGDRYPLTKIVEYVKQTGKLCPDASDSRCDVTPSMNILIGLALGKEPNVGEDIVDIATISAEAVGAPEGYQTFLVARKVMLHKLLGRKGYDPAAETLRKRMPGNPFVVAVAGDYKKSAELLVNCMKSFSSPGKVVSFHSPKCVGVDGFGFDLVSLGKWLVQRG